MGTYTMRSRTSIIKPGFVYIKFYRKSNIKISLHLFFSFLYLFSSNLVFHVFLWVVGWLSRFGLWPKSVIQRFLANFNLNRDEHLQPFRLTRFSEISPRKSPFVSLKFIYHDFVLDLNNRNIGRHQVFLLHWCIHPKSFKFPSVV